MATIWLFTVSYSFLALVLLVCLSVSDSGAGFWAMLLGMVGSRVLFIAHLSEGYRDIGRVWLPDMAWLYSIYSVARLNKGVILVVGVEIC